MIRRIIGLVGIFCCASAFATPANKAALERHFDRFLPKSLQSCNTCHLPTDKKDPESIEEIPHNAFGEALRKVGKQLKAEGKKRDIPTRMALLSAADSDGDGVDNLTELLTGHNPGDAKDKPSPGEVAAAAVRSAEFAAFLKSYRWQPFEPLKRPDFPQIAHGQWARNPIDAFVAQQLETRALSPAPEAPKHILLRRVYIDLTGLNPTPDEITAFELDNSPSAYEKVVDRILNSPAYGQRWARHWMDIWRYSDWAGWSGGGQIRDSQPHIWRWRDWIVESLNADKGYDRMATEMLAADELSPGDESAIRATGFLVRNYKMLSREQWLEDTLNHTSRAFLGITMHCAKCHEHKYDPIAQEEYYHLRAIFEPHNVRLDPVPGEIDTKIDGLARAFDADPAAQTYLFIRGDERTPDKARGAITPAVPAFLGGTFKAQPINLPATDYQPDRRETVIKDTIAASQKTITTAQAALDKAIGDKEATYDQRAEAKSANAVAKATHAALLATLKAEELEGKKDSPQWKQAASEALNAQRKQTLAQAAHALLLAQNKIPPGPTTRPAATQTPTQKDAADKLNQASFAKLAEAQKAFDKARADLATPLTTAYAPRKTRSFPATSTGRRLAFAKWLVDPANPLSPRVAANHLWARHFAQGLVPSVDDFGRNGRTATHPALLDWLASELLAQHWQMKPIHRLIVTSATYRQSSHASADIQSAAHAADPDNTLLYRYPSKRIEAEAVRDNVLYASSQLDLSQGGPDIDQSLGLTSKRRSLYFRTAPEKEVEFLKVFDGPNPNECYCRRPSVIPQQALALANSQLVVEQSKLLAQSLAKYTEPQAFIHAAFLRILARNATAAELTACTHFLASEKSPDRARENLIVVLFNHNDFVTLR